MRRSRRRLLDPPTLSRAAFVLAILVAAGCAAEQVRLVKGESWPVAWEVTDIRQTLEERGNRMRWDFMLVFKNKSSTTITFEEMSLITMIPGGNVNMSGGYTTRPFVRTLEPGVEVRDVNGYSHGCTMTCDPQYVQQMFRTGVMRVIELRGRDASGRSVATVIRLRLDSTVGTKPTPAEATIGPTPIRELKQIAGTWRGTMFGSGSPPATVTIESDGRYAWRGDRESGAGTLRTSPDGRVVFESSAGRRGTFTLHESDGRRRLAIDYEGVDWKGWLAPLR